jgi:hypothetical protein
MLKMDIDGLFIRNGQLKNSERKVAYSNPAPNHLTPNDLQRRRAVNPLKFKIPSKNMREKPTNTQFIHSVY